MFDPYGPPPSGYFAAGAPPPPGAVAYGAPPPPTAYGVPAAYVPAAGYSPVDPYYGQPVGYDQYGRAFVVAAGSPVVSVLPPHPESSSKAAVSSSEKYGPTRRRRGGRRRGKAGQGAQQKQQSDDDSDREKNHHKRPEHSNAATNAGVADKQGKGGGKRGAGKARADHGCNIYVYYVPASWDSEELKKCFAHYGEVVSCNVMKKDTGESRGYGFVGFDTVEAARTAILGMDGFPTDEGKFLSVRPKKGEEQIISPKNYLYPPSGRVDVGPTGGRAPQGANIYVYNIPLEWDEGHFYRHFIHYGQITSITIMRKEETGESRGFGFIGFEQPSSAIRAVRGMNGFEPRGGKPLLVSIKKGEEEAAEVFMKLLLLTDAMQKEDMTEEALQQLAEAPVIDTAAQPVRSSLQSVPPDANLFVLHIPEQWNDEDFRRYFDPFGKILSITIVRNGDGASKGYGFVGYAKASDAAQAIQCMNGTKVGKNTLIVKLKEDRWKNG